MQATEPLLEDRAVPYVVQVVLVTIPEHVDTVATFGDVLVV